MSIEELDAKFQKLSSTAASVQTMSTIIDEVDRVKTAASDISKLWDKCDKEFESLTSLTKTDWSFLLFATGLQCIRQYFLTDFKKRLSDKDAAGQTRGHFNERSNRSAGWYRASREDIWSNPVPFDATFCGTKPHVGLSGFNHRYKVLGHDPIFGYVVGTANILTNTLTMSNLQSYHIKTGYIKTGASRDQINCKAKNDRIFSSVKCRLIEEGWNGRLDFATALLKEHIHLRSDIKTQQSLPIPGISRLDDKLAKNMADYGFDMANVENIGKQAIYAILINFIIAALHRLCKPEDIENDIYACRTKKILSYSNALATSSNIIYCTMIGPYIEDAQAMKKIDIGGMMVTFYRLISDLNFQYKIKEEFIFSQLHTKITNL